MQLPINVVELTQAFLQGIGILTKAENQKSCLANSGSWATNHGLRLDKAKL